MNIFRKKSRKKIVVTLLICMFANYLVSPLSVFAGTLDEEIISKIATIDTNFTTAATLNNDKILTCSIDRYCTLATTAIDTELNNMKDIYDNSKLGIKLSKLVAETNKPTDYDHLTDDAKDILVIYNSLNEIKESYEVSESYCIYQEVKDETYATQETCEVATGVWHTETSTKDAIISVLQQQTMIDDYLSSIKIELDGYLGEKYSTLFNSKVASLKEADKTLAENEIVSLITKVDNLSTERETVNSKSEAFHTANVVTTYREFTKDQVKEYLKILKDEYTSLENLEDYMKEYVALINNKIYNNLYGDTWATTTMQLTSKTDTLEAKYNGTSFDSVTTVINNIADISNLNNSILDADFLVDLLEYIDGAMPMVSKANIDKINDALSQYYYLTSIDSSVIIDNETNTILVEKDQTSMTVLAPLKSSNIQIANISISNFAQILTSEGSYQAIVKTTSIVDLTLSSSNISIKEYTVAVRGDVNGDGKVDLLDLTEIESLVLGNTSADEYTNAQLKAMDYNRDGQYNITDIVMLYNSLAPQEI